MTRIQLAFRKARDDGRAALLAYLMAGDPTLSMSETLALACARAGADLLELGVPFSDPIADGVEIQAAGVRSLRAGTRPRDVLTLAGRLRRKTEVPIVLMTYMNPVLAMGLDDFASKSSEAGVDGVIVPDLSLEESDEVRSVFDAHGVDHIQLVAPSTPEDRARAVGDASRGFLYVVARYGTTGTHADLSPQLEERLRVLRRCTSLPLAVGFGVSTRDQVRTVARMGADGVVIGSAIVQKIGEDPNPEAVESFVRGLAAGVKP